MNRILVTSLLSFVIACGGSDKSCTMPPQPEPAPTATATVPQPDPEPPKPSIDWRPFSEETYTMVSSTGQCLFAYFGGSECGEDCNYVEDSVFTDDGVINVINDMYVAVRYPVDTQKEEAAALGIVEFPTFVLIFVDEDAVSNVVTGIAPANVMRDTFRVNDEVYAACKEVKDNVNAN